MPWFWTGTDASEQLLKPEWLCHIIIRSEFQPLDLIANIIPRCQNDDLSGDALPSQLFQNR